MERNYPHLYLIKIYKLTSALQRCKIGQTTESQAQPWRTALQEPPSNLTCLFQIEDGLSVNLIGLI